MTPVDLLSIHAVRNGIFERDRIKRIVREHPGLDLRAWLNAARKIDRYKSLDEIERWLREDVEPEGSPASYFDKELLSEGCARCKKILYDDYLLTRQKRNEKQNRTQV